MAASFAPAAAASLFRMTSLSDGASTQTIVAARFRHQCLEQARRIDAERLRRLHADAVGIRVVVVFVQRESGAGLLKRDGRGRALGHQ